MDKWGKFLFGTPRRTLGTLIGILVVVAMVSPDTIEQALNNLLTAVQPLVSMVITLAILIALLKWAFKKIK
jgi:hypothetical protein